MNYNRHKVTKAPVLKVAELCCALATELSKPPEGLVDL
jgi:hypothetical protein